MNRAIKQIKEPHPWADLDELQEVHGCDVLGADNALNQLVAIREASKQLLVMCAEAEAKGLGDEVGSLASGVEADLEDLEVSIAQGVKAMNAAEDRRFDKCHTRLRGLSSHQQAAE